MKWKNLHAEIEAHIEEKALELMESGVEEKQAWAQARRAMNANRLFTFVAVASLALGIGANTAIYSFMDAILLRSLPVADPQSLVVLKFQRPKAATGETRGTGYDGNMRSHITSGGSHNGSYSVFPYPAFEVFQKRSDLFTTVFSYHGQTEARLTLNGGAILGDSVYVSGDYFAGLGALQLSLERIPSGRRMSTCRCRATCRPNLYGSLQTEHCSRKRESTGWM